MIPYIYMGYSGNIYYILSTAIFTLYILSYIGLFDSKEKIETLEFYFRLFIGLMLIYIFNPFVTKELHKTDRYIAFSGGTAILMMLGLNKIHDHFNTDIDINLFKIVK
jgi:FtsH-binding integral membrane protein|tara:strand:- start:1838 stop:2161 length:324 start_codon:yes stop_codon:yes gene_type:complete